MKKSKNAPVNRRSFLTGAVTGAAALVTKPAITAAALWFPTRNFKMIESQIDCQCRRRLKPAPTAQRT